MTPTPEQIDALVKAAEDVMRAITDDGNVWYEGQKLDEALAPIRALNKGPKAEAKVMTTTEQTKTNEPQPEFQLRFLFPNGTTTATPVLQYRYALSTATIGGVRHTTWTDWQAVPRVFE